MVSRFVLLYLISLLIMAVFYSEIVLHLWKRKASGVHIEKNQKRIEKQKRKVVTIRVTIVTLFVICWLPAHVNNFLLTFNFKEHSCLHTSLILIFTFWITPMQSSTRVSIWSLMRVSVKDLSIVTGLFFFFFFNIKKHTLLNSSQIEN